MRKVGRRKKSEERGRQQRKKDKPERPIECESKSESEGAPARAAERVQQRAAGAWALDCRTPGKKTRPAGQQAIARRRAEGRGSGARRLPTCLRAGGQPVPVPVPVLQCHSRIAWPMGGGWLAAGAAGPASSERPGGRVLWCACPWGPGEGRAERSAGGTGPWVGQESQQDTPFSPTYLGTSGGKRDPVRGACVHLGMVVSAWLGAWLKVVWGGSRI